MEINQVRSGDGEKKNDDQLNTVITILANTANCIPFQTIKRSVELVNCPLLISLLLIRGWKGLMTYVIAIHISS